MSRLTLPDLKTILYPERLKDPFAEGAGVTETRGGGASEITRYRDKQGNGDIVWRIKKKYNSSIDRLQKAEIDILYKITTRLDEFDKDSQGRVSTIGVFNPKRGFINLDCYDFDLEDWQRLCSAADDHNHAQWCDAVFLLRLLRAALLALRGIHRLDIVHCDIRKDNLCLSGEGPFEKEGKRYIRLNPGSLVLIDFGIAVENGDSSRLSGIVFPDENVYWKSQELHKAHKKLQALGGKYPRNNQYPTFSYSHGRRKKPESAPPSYRAAGNASPSSPPDSP